jgi:hypothetical protein
VQVVHASRNGDGAAGAGRGAEPAVHVRDAWHRREPESRRGAWPTERLHVPRQVPRRSDRVKRAPSSRLGIVRAQKRGDGDENSPLLIQPPAGFQYLG